jgi:signal transduction histidine kinase
LAYSNVVLVESLRGLTRQMVRGDEETRKSVARELHDTVLQELILVIMKIQRQQRKMAEDGIRLDEFVEGIEGGIDSLRQIMSEQRPPELDRSLMDAMDEMKRDYELSEIEGVQVEWAEKDEVRLPDGIATTLYRIA